MDLVLACLLIIVARILDVSIGTIRTICIVKDKRAEAVVLGFFESLIWVIVVAKVAGSLDQPALVFSYALGFALGNYVGLTLERRLALGNQVLRIFTRNTEKLLNALREKQIPVTRFIGEGRDGSVDLLMTKLPRKRIPYVTALVQGVDDGAFYFIDDIGETSDPSTSLFSPTGWRSWTKRK